MYQAYDNTRLAVKHKKMLLDKINELQEIKDVNEVVRKGYVEKLNSILTDIEAINAEIADLNTIIDKINRQDLTIV